MKKIKSKQKVGKAQRKQKFIILWDGIATKLTFRKDKIMTRIYELIEYDKNFKTEKVISLGINMINRMKEFADKEDMI